MNGKPHGEVILFPSTIDYYQIELTKLLEKERYSEAIQLLQFLSECKTQDPRLNEEWRTLRLWLEQEFPDARPGGDPDLDDSDGVVNESDLRRRNITSKAAKDKQYTKKLLESLSQSSIDKQLFALDQLGFMKGEPEEDEIAAELQRRLQAQPLHPFVSFKLLQTMVQLGAYGEVTFGKLGEIVTVDVERTPLSLEQFPDPIPVVSERVFEVAEMDDPTISAFAKQTWEEFQAYIYGTAVYQGMIGMGEQDIDIWACALHGAVAMTMHGRLDEEQLQERYGITLPLQSSWEKAYKWISQLFWKG